MLQLVKKKKKKPLSLKMHYERRNKVLIKRRCGGYGDILMQRMMFEDLQKLSPLEFTFSCPLHYIDMAKNHPYMTAIDLNCVNEDDYGAVYDITTACRVHESKYGAKNKTHRSDIWAEYCGAKLENHNMFLTPEPDMINECQKVLEHHNKENKPTVMLATTSTNDDFGISKSLTEKQIMDLVTALRDKYFLFTVHNEEQEIYKRLGVQQFTGIHPKAWIAITNLANYVISVDTATFHMAGGLKKPLVGIFTFTDGKVYGKYYDFVLVQKHRDNGDWDCGPCFNVGLCPKTQTECYPKPCLLELKSADILQGFEEAVKRWPLSRNDQKNIGTCELGHTA